MILRKGIGMILRRDWEQFREQFPELAEMVKSLGTSLYDMGVEQAQTSEELEALTLLGCSVPLERSLVLRSVFSLGAQMLFDLEEGRSS
jgi:hypothetical protein